MHWDSSQDGSTGKHSLPSHTTHTNYKYTIEQPSLRTVRNRVEWKSDNYKIRETTSIQTGRMGRDAEQAGPTLTCGR